MSKLYARKCCNCGCGMDEGYVWGDGEGYACSDECLYVDGYTEEQFEIDYDDGEGCIYWTEWDEEEIVEDGYGYTKDGREVEL